MSIKKKHLFFFENLLIKIKNDLIKILINLTIVKIINEYENTKKTNKIVNNPKYVDKIKVKKYLEMKNCGSGKKYKHCCGRLSF